MERVIRAMSSSLFASEFFSAHDSIPPPSGGSGAPRDAPFFSAPSHRTINQMQRHCDDQHPESEQDGYDVQNPEDQGAHGLFLRALNKNVLDQNN